MYVYISIFLILEVYENFLEIYFQISSIYADALVYIPNNCTRRHVYYSTDLQMDVKRSKLQFSVFIILLKSVYSILFFFFLITSRLGMPVSFKYTPKFNRNTDWMFLSIWSCKAINQNNYNLKFVFKCFLFCCHLME